MRMVCAIVMAIFCVTGCANRKNQNLAGANAVLKKVGKFAEDSFYSCLLNGYAQGLSAQQARDECATKLLEDDKKGFGGSIGDIRPGTESFFDPSVNAFWQTYGRERFRPHRTDGSATIPSGWMILKGSVCKKFKNLNIEYKISRPR
jgi:hypothetical protein